MKCVSMRGLNARSVALRKACVMRAASSGSGRVPSRSVAGARDVQQRAGFTEAVETDNGECYGMFCYNFDFDKVRQRTRDEPQRRSVCGLARS